MLLWHSFVACKWLTHSTLGHKMEFSINLFSSVIVTHNHTVRCHYDTVNFLWNSHNISYLSLLNHEDKIHVLPQLLQCCMQLLCFVYIYIYPGMHFKRQPGPCLNIKTVFPSMGIPMLKTKRWYDRLIFNMGIPFLVRWHLCIETAVRLCPTSTDSKHWFREELGAHY